jgi:hypothetical protein
MNSTLARAVPVIALVTALVARAAAMLAVSHLGGPALSTAGRSSGMQSAASPGSK